MVVASATGLEGVLLLYFVVSPVAAGLATASIVDIRQSGSWWKLAVAPSLLLVLFTWNWAEGRSTLLPFLGWQLLRQSMLAQPKL